HVSRSLSASRRPFLLRLSLIVGFADRSSSLGCRRARALLLDPAHHVPLGSHTDGESAGRDILADDGTCTGVGSVTNPNGRGEHVVRARSHVRADRGAVLVHTVV